MLDRIVNVLDKVAKKEQAQASALLTAIPYAASRQEAWDRKKKFQQWCEKRGFAAAAQLIDVDWERRVAFYSFPKEHWKHLRTTNPVESPFAAVRIRTTAAKRFKKVENATAVIWKTLMIAEKHFRRLDAPELLAEGAEGAVYVDEVRVKKAEKEIAA
jgi:transposase-like protein